MLETIAILAMLVFAIFVVPRLERRKDKLREERRLSRELVGRMLDGGQISKKEAEVLYDQFDERPYEKILKDRQVGKRAWDAQMAEVRKKAAQRTKQAKATE